MSESLIAEFAEHLGEVARRHAGHPHAELDELWRIGLEREAIVTVAYRHDRIGRRLSKMPLDDDARAVIARAVRWAWRDEQAHALWVRGAHMKWNEAASAVAAETRGRIGGWMSSEQHNVRWRDAPVGRAVAEAIALLGNVTGSVPAAVKRSLRWSTFVEICAFNHGAETTAAMAWRRMAELAALVDDENSRRGFLRMAEDEDRHARVFAILRDAFDGHDRLQIATPDLRARLHKVGQRFVALPDTHGAAWKNPLGKGGTVIVRDGNEAAAVVNAALDASRLAIAPGATIAIKATFMLVTRGGDLSPGVSPTVLAAIIAWCEQRGARVQVIDARNLYDRFHEHRDVRSVAQRIGMPGEIVDAQDDQVPHVYTRGLGVETISRTWRDADVRILVGKLRSHPTSTALLALEAAEGLGARHDDLLFLERRAERETAVLMALDAAPPHLAVLDAWSDVPDGLMGVLGHDRPLQPRRIYAATDAVALDAIACRHIGAEPNRGGMLLDTAFDWFGDPRAQTVVDGPGTPIEGFRLPDHSTRTALLSALALPAFTFASGRGALFLPRFDDDAFPPLRPSKLLAAARAVIRKIVADEPDAPRSASPLPTTMLATRAGAVRIARVGQGGTPLVCLHGYPETLQIWSALAPRLAREVIAFDWPGLGYSSPVVGAAHPYALADHLLAVLDAAGLARVDLLAADMGAPAALVFAARHPERVDRVTCTSALLFGDAATSIEISVMRKTGFARAAFGRVPKLVYARCKQSMLEHELPAAIDDDFSAAFARTHVRERLGWMCVDYERTLPDLPETYWKLRCPVQLLWAEDDHHFAVEHAERLAAIVPTARVHVIPGAKHWMMFERAAECAVAGQL
ncbi:MAG: alpha/beta fold hydrolase [Myxococcota bacterium]|nr:alpha/beta fold hydrolase [Myxococcota bacterium]